MSARAPLFYRASRRPSARCSCSSWPRSAPLGLGAGTLARFPTFERNAERRLSEAMSYCDSLRPALESHRATHGVYPARLSDVAPGGERPLLLRTGATTYDATAEHYVLKISNSGGLAFRGARFDSTTGVWTR